MKKNCFTTQDLLSLPQSWPLPREMKAIDIIAAGGIVKDAHLPAYRKAGFLVSGIYDPNPEQARERAKEFDIPRVYESLEEAVSQGNVIDLATSPEAHLEVLEQIPQGSAVLIQKTMGRNLEEAPANPKTLPGKATQCGHQLPVVFQPEDVPDP